MPIADGSTTTQKEKRRRGLLTRGQSGSQNEMLFCIQQLLRNLSLLSSDTPTDDQKQNLNIQHAHPRHSSHLTFAAITPAALSFLYLTLSPSKSKPNPISIPSPLKTLLPAQVSALLYPPNLLPCARDVETQYGSMRVYEWGPEEGRKVLMIHGDTPPVRILAEIARGVVEKGCMVMLFGKYR